MKITWVKFSLACIICGTLISMLGLVLTCIPACFYAHDISVSYFLAGLTIILWGLLTFIYVKIKKIG